MTLPLPEYLATNTWVAAGIAADAVMASVARFPRFRTHASAWRWAAAIGLTHGLFPLAGYAAGARLATAGWVAGVHALAAVLMGAFTVRLVRVATRAVEGLDRAAPPSRTWPAVWALSLDALVAGPALAASTAGWTESEVAWSFPLLGATVFVLVLAAGHLALALHRRYLVPHAGEARRRRAADVRRLALALVASFYVELLLFGWFCARSAVEAARASGSHVPDALPWVAAVAVVVAVAVRSGRRIHGVRRGAARALVLDAVRGRAPDRT